MTDFRVQMAEYAKFELNKKVLVHAVMLLMSRAMFRSDKAAHKQNEYDKFAKDAIISYFVNGDNNKTFLDLKVAEQSLLALYESIDTYFKTEGATLEFVCFNYRPITKLQFAKVGILIVDFLKDTPHLVVNIMLEGIKISPDGQTFSAPNLQKFCSMLNHLHIINPNSEANDDEINDQTD